jgi:hypothetical protein
LSLKEDEIKEMQNDSSRNLADVLHYLIFHAGNVQLYHELRLSVGDDVGKFSEIISRAQREIPRLMRDEEHKSYISKMKWPNEGDIECVQKCHAKYGRKYIQVLLGMAAGTCQRCWDEKKGGGE